MATIDLQSLLVQQEIVTVEQVRDAVESTAGTSSTWLDALLRAHALDEQTVVRCACAEVGVPPCDLDRLATLPGDVLALLPADLAVEHRMVPLWLEPDGDLCVGMLDPCDVAAVREVEFFLGRHLLREVVPATPLAWALTTYYGARCALWPPSRAGDAPPPERPARRLARGSDAPPLAARVDDDLAYEVEIVEDPSDEDSIAIVGRAPRSAAVLVEIADAPTDRIPGRRRA